MIDRYTVRSFEKMEFHPDCVADLVDEAYFGTMDECEHWCCQHLDIKHLNFEIHHSIGAKNYRFGVASGMGIITWLVRDYAPADMPAITPWWDIYDVPFQIDDQCQPIEF